MILLELENEEKYEVAFDVAGVVETVVVIAVLLAPVVQQPGGVAGQEGYPAGTLLQVELSHMVPHPTNIYKLCCLFLHAFSLANHYVPNSQIM